MSLEFALADVTVQAGAPTILQITSLKFSRPDFVAIAGPNGAGKSTLLKVLSGLRSTYNGTCHFRGKEMRRWPRREFARVVAVVSQNSPVDFPFTAHDVVTMGRAPHAPGWFESEADRHAVAEAFDLTGAAPLRDREFNTLSGGEQQRVVIAAALAQQPEILLLDEPAVYLDVQHQLELYRLLAQLRDRGLLVITTTHDLNLAIGFADRFLVLNHGQLVADGQPMKVVTADLIKSVFHIDATLHHTETGRLWMQYHV